MLMFSECYISFSFECLFKFGIMDVTHMESVAFAFDQVCLQEHIQFLILHCVEWQDGL